MKILITIARIIVGLLFIFSGLVKANDPLGLSYKMQEFFEVWGIHGFNSWTLLMSVLMNAFEIIAGFALLLGWRIKLFSWLLLLLIVFFTFLTGYTYFTGEPKNCGCFGDCLPISSKTSFLKDIALLLLIGLLFRNQKLIRPFLSPVLTFIKMAGLTVLAFGFQWYTLTYLPIVDCLPFKKENNITEKMKAPANAIPDSFAIKFVYKKNGKEFEFSTSELPADLDTYTFISRRDKLIRKGNADPPIKGFVLTGPTNIDSTEMVLSQPYAILLFCEDFSVPVHNWKNDFEKIYKQAEEKHIPVYMVTAAPDAAIKAIAETAFAGIQIFKADFKAILTAARANPTLYLLKKGTVVDKWSGKRMYKAIKELNKVSPQKAMEAPLPVVTDTSNQ